MEATDEQKIALYNSFNGSDINKEKLMLLGFTYNKKFSGKNLWFEVDEEISIEYNEYNDLVFWCCNHTRKLSLNVCELRDFINLIKK